MTQTDAPPLTRDQIEALDTKSDLSPQEGTDLSATALLAWTEDGRLWKDVAEKAMRADMSERESHLETLDELATERARREACEAALMDARVLVDKWCYRQGNDPSIFQQYLGPIDAALNHAKVNAGE